MRHITTIISAEAFEHHPLLLLNPECKEHADSQESGCARQPIRHQQDLRERQEEKRGIHRMPNKSIYAGRYEPVLLADFE